MTGITLCILLVCTYHVSIAQEEEQNVQKYELQTINILPESIDADGWQGTEHILTQDLGDDSLFGEFDKENSAYVSNEEDEKEEVIQPVSTSPSSSENTQPSPPQAPPPSEDSTSTSTVEEQLPSDDVSPGENDEVSDTPTETDTSDGVTPEEDTEPQEQDQEIKQPEETLQDETETENGQGTLEQPEGPPSEETTQEEVIHEEPTEESAAENEVTINVFKAIRGLYQFAAGVFTASSTVTTDDESEQVKIGQDETDAEEETNTAETISEDSEAEIRSEPESVENATTSESIDIASPEETTENNKEIDGEVEVIEITEATSSPQTLPEETTGEQDSLGDAVAVDPSVSCEENILLCRKQQVSLSGFGVGDVFADQRIVNAQLRLSLAGRPKNIEHPDQLVIEYIYEGDLHSGGVITIDDEVSNAINGGYFLYALPIYYDWQEFDDLQINLTYLSGSKEPGEIYLDSAWIEVDSIDKNAPSVETPLPETEPLRREAPEGYEFSFMHRTSDFTSGERPVFTYHAAKDRSGFINLLRSGFNTLIGREERSNLRMRIVDSAFADIAQIHTGEGGEFVVEIPKTRSFKPGKYLFTIEVTDDEEVFYIDQEFTWGVLALNVDKSLYHLEEEAYMQMGVLDDFGHTICDADLDLVISGPEGNTTRLSTDDGSITYSNECAGDSFTLTPDYFTYFDRLEAVGIYRVELTATTKNGEYTIIDNFEVWEDIPFDVTRTGPTRIYPPEPYPVTLTITAREAYQGEIIEYVPQNFQVFAPEDATLPFRTHEAGDTKQLIWDVALKEDQTITLAYFFDAPDISPEFYLLGPLLIGEFGEIREWQIASDAVSFDNSGGVNGTSFSFDIGSAGTDRLVTVFADDESTGVNLSGVTVDGNACNLVTIADNSNGIGNHQELWYCDEDDLGSSNGSVTVAITGGDAGWAVHAHLYTNVTQSGPFNSGIDNTSAAVNTATVNNVSSPESGLVVAGWATGQGGLTESAQTSPLTTRQNGPVPTGGADFFTSSGIESLPQTNKTYQFTFSGNHNRASGIVATWDPIRTTTVSSVGNQKSLIDFATTSAYVGGAFSLVTDISTTSVTSITITENGTVDAASDLDNIELYYEFDTTAPYDCASESFTSTTTETQYGSTDTDGFSGANGTATFTDSVTIASTSAMCVYTVLDVTSGASINETLEIEINDATGGDVVVSQGEVTPGTAVALSDTSFLTVVGVPSIPILVENPAFDNLYASTTPILGGFVAIDDEGDFIEYEVSIDNNIDFSSPATTTMSSNFPGDAGWASTTFASGATTTYSMQPADALSDGTTYWWRVRARDPGGTNVWSPHSEIWSVTISDGLEKPAWHQTLGLQFENDTLSNISTTTGGAVLTTLKDPIATTTDSFESVGDGSTDLSSTNLWKQASISTDDGDWQAETGVTGSDPTGPDEGSDGSVFIYTEVSDGTECDSTGGDTNECIIEADIVDGTLDSIQFDYHMFGTQIGTLSLDLYDGSSWTTVWTRSGQQSTDGTDWQDSGYLDLSVHKATTTALRFYAIGTGDTEGYLGDIALDNIRVGTSLPGGTGTVMSPEIDFAWVDNETDWGAVEWNVAEPTGTDTRLRLYYTSSTTCDTLIPNGDLPGNSAGLDASDSGFFITSLSTTTYDRICLNMTLDQGSGTTTPTLNDWTLSWVIPDQVPSTPVLAETPAFESVRSTTTQPIFGGFAASDYENDLMEYEFSIDDDYDFSSPATTTVSSNYPGDAGWSASTFASGATTTYQIQETLTPGTTYWWRVRARDPFGTNTWSEYSVARSMTVSASYNLSQWFETEGEQFEQGTLISIATSTGSISIQDATTTSLLSTWSTGNTKTVPSGNDRLLVVVVTSEDSGTDVDVNTVTYGGQTLTQIEEQQAGAGFSNGIWMGYLDEQGIQNAGSTTITPTWVGGTPDNFIQYASIVFENVDQAAPIGGSSSNFDTDGSTIQVPDALNTESGDYTIYASVLGQENNTHTPDTGYTEVTEQNTGGNGMVTATALKAATTTTTEQPTASWSASFRMGMAAAVIQPGTATGSVLSRDVDFDWVPNQQTWGEVVWSTSEPASADTTLQLYYTNSTECDTIIPDGALTGNSTGFSFSQSPLDISGLSTTTYNRICLRMAFDKGSTSTSPTLDDWTISWERNPILTQNYYHWYNNTDAVTPTDTWPPGSAESELGENEAITSNEPVAFGDVVRLRMTLLGSSTAASAGQFTYKLQYAQSNSCSSVMNWLDVGPIGSTTALWRGYDNTSVSDGATLSSTTISVSDVAATYEEENNSASIPNTINVGDDAEWDWVLEHNADAGESYCFRMTQSDGTTLSGGYVNYPQLVTNLPPNTPTLDTLFDNEKTPSTTPFFEFTVADPEEEDVDYQIQIDNDADFSSTIVDTNSIVNLTDFENLDTPSDKSPYIQGETIRYTPATSFTNGNTYWWRVRATDQNGSNVYGDWSTVRSFTVDTSVTVSTWFQTTEEQFDTDTLFGTDATGADLVTLATGSTTGTTTSSMVDFDWVTVGNAWGELSFNDSEAGGSTILYHIEYYNGSSWQLIPDSDLSGNSVGFGSSPVDLIDLDTVTYNQIRIRADFSDTGTPPTLSDWTLSWGQRVSVPTHLFLFDNEKTPTTTPTFRFYTSDPQDDDLEYEISWSTDATFTTSSTTRNSGTDAGFSDITTPADTTPFGSGDTIQFTVQPGDALTDDTTYWWRVRARDPAGGNSYSFWSDPWSFTASSTTNVSTWFQTTQEQFDTDTLVNVIASTSDSVLIPESVSVGVLDNWTTGNTKTISAGSDRLLIFAVYSEDSGTSVDVNSATFGGQLLTEIGDQQQGAGFSNGMWVGYLDDAGIEAASGNTLLVNWLGGTPDNFIHYASVVLENVDQTAPIPSAAGGTDGGSTTFQATTSISVQDGDMAIYTAVSGQEGLTHTPSTGYTEGTEEDSGGNGMVSTNAYMSITADGTEQPTATWSGTVNRHAMVTFAVRHAQTVTSGTLTSSPIDFDDGSGPAWEQIYWSDSEPGSSSILYQVEYLAPGDVWILVPDGDLAGNASGLTTAPIDIKSLNTDTYNEIRIVGSFTCSGVDCPALNDWTVEWAEGIDISGTIHQYDQTSSTTSGTVAVAVNGTLQIGKTGAISNGTWQIDNVTMFPNDVITVFVSGAADANEAVAVTKYDGVPEMTGLELYERHLSIGSDDLATTSNADIGLYDFTNDEDLFFDVDGGGDLDVCATTGCGDAEIIILSGNSYLPQSGEDVTTHDIEINGTFVPGANTVRVSGSWDNNGTFTAGNSTIIFTATTTTESVDSTGASTASFNNVTFGETLGTATWQLSSALDINGNTNITFGTLDQNGANAISLANNLTIGANGLFSAGTATTTFDSAGTQTWTDNSSPKQDLGIVTIDGATTTVQLGSAVALTDLVIGANDTFNVTGGDYAVTVSGDWTNNNTFTPHQGEVIFAGTSSHVISDGGDAFYDLTFNGAGGGWAFTNPTLSVDGDFTVATGTVTMPTGTTTFDGSFSSAGGTFAHNNSVFRFTSNAAETITASGTLFTNTFYDLVFDGNGSWTMQDTNATTSNNVTIESGTVTFPGGIFAIGNNFDNNDTFTHNDGTVRFYATDVDNTVDPGSSSFGSITFDGVGGGWRLPTASNVDVDNDLTILNGVATSTNSTLTVGGSWSNNDTFVPGTGTVRFDSADIGETIDAGNSVFYDAIFDATTGGWTITDHATTSNNFTLTNASDFTLASGQVLAVSGAFTNSVGGASTTWSGATLALLSGTSYSINAKTDNGDAYDTLQVAANTDVKMWNSQATTTAVDSTGSLYSQDNATIDGELYIYGNYPRTSGTEYWSYAMDFDGTSLGATTSRQVSVQFASGASATFSNATLEVIGDFAASTTITNQGSGTYTIDASGGTTTMNYYDLDDLGTTGLRFTDGGVVTSLSDGAFTPAVAAGTAITISSTTIDANPALQIFRVNFSTTTAIDADNVTQTDGIPASYWWFRNSTGNIDGEANDNDTGNPGSVRWDDSAISIALSGTVYDTDETASLGGPTCDDTTPNVHVVINGGFFSSSTPCSSADGSYSFSAVSFTGDPDIIVYLDTNGGVTGSALTKTATVDITDMDIIANRVIVRHEDTDPMRIADMATYDNSDDSDIAFTAATGTPNALTVLPDNELHVWATSTFTPGGSVTLQSGGTGNSYDGALHLDNGSTFTGSGTTTYSVGGSFFQDIGATFVPASSTVLMTATTSGKAISTQNSETLMVHELQFVGVGGNWNLSGDITASANIAVATGTVTGTADVTLTNGSLSGAGLLSLGGGTVTLEMTNSLGGIQPWTFNNLTLGNGSVVGTTTPLSSATTTVGGVLTIANAHFLDAGSSLWNLSGTSSVFVETGTFLEDTSRVRYSGSGATNILSTDYYNLTLEASAGSPTYTATGLGVQILNDLVIGGASTTIATFDTNDTALNVDGDMRIKNNGTFIASNSGTFTLAGSYDNNGTFTHSNGTLTFDGAGTHTVAAGNSLFGTAIINAAGDITVTEHATATNAFTLTAANDFTVASGQALAVGGTFSNNLADANTTWSGATLFLYGGNNYSVNASTTDDTYATLIVGADTDIRMWNSNASTTIVDGTGSLYSQDHTDVPGDLYIYGNYPGNGGTDYWNYARDFDGTDLSGGNERKVDVFFASGASLALTSGGLQILGDASASTTLQNQGSGTYGFRIGGSASTSMQYYEVRDVNSGGLTFSGTPNVVTLSNGDFLIDQVGGSGITVGGTVIDANPALNFNQNIFATTSVLASAFNVTATGTTVSSWRFTNHSGNWAGEQFDQDPDGDPGYIVWDDSAANISISGNVYSDEGSSVSTVCDSSTTNIELVVAGVTNFSTSCNGDGGGGGTGLYTFSGVSYGPNDSLIVYINGETEQAATVTVDPVSNINNMDLYENRVIVRHENTDPITIADMAVFDSSDDGDIPFTATTDLTLPADTKLIVWNNKEFEPGGNVTLSGGGAGAAYDGTLELYGGAQFTAQGSESHAIGGSFISGAGASFEAANSTVTFTTTGASRTIDTNDDAFYGLTFNGTGSWTVTNTTLDVGNDFTLTQGDVTLPSGTTTVSGTFNNTGGTFDANGGSILFDSSGNENIRAGGSDFGTTTFDGTGSWTYLDTNATTTGAYTVTSGIVIAPGGVLAVGTDFVVANGTTFSHNGGILRLTSNAASTSLSLNGEDLSGLTFDGAGTFIMTDSNLAVLGDLTIAQGSVTFATGTLSIGGSFQNNDTFSHASGTTLFNAGTTGHTVDAGGNDLYNVVFASGLGGWTMLSSATTTNNFSITSANSYTQQSGTTLTVEGVFTNTAGGSATTWNGSTLNIQSGVGYTINTKAAGGDRYDTLIIGPNTDIRMWDSHATTTNVDSLSSLYSQDHGGVNGELYIYGDYTRTTGTDYWSYATDFDGTALGGSPRTVTVYHATSATTTIAGGTLAITGNSSGTTTITNQGGGTYAFLVTSGTLNASEYAVRNINADGFNLQGTSTISSLSNGDFELAINGGSLITVSSTTLNANASKIITGMRFATTTAITGTNVERVGTTTSIWSFTNHRGNLDGEAYDIDGGDNCGSIRWTDSNCQVTEQTHYRWRNDDGGEGVPDSEWYDLSFGKRKRITLTNSDATGYVNAAVQLDVTYDADMQSDFDDIRFTESDGTTLISHWTETVNASTDAVVWAQVPLLATSTDTEIYMYYGSSTVADASATSTFLFLDDFEDGDIAEYSGDTSLFDVDTEFNYERSFGLDNGGSESQKATDGIYRTDVTVSQGETLRYFQYVDTSAGSGDEPCTLFGVQSPGSDNQNYAVCLEQFGTDRVSLSQDVSSNDSDGPATVIASSTITYVTGWHEVEIGWQTDDTIDVTVSRNGSVVATTSATDGTYTSGGIGFSFWFHNGGWDIYSSRPYLATEPSVAFGAEQVPGGASWSTALDTVNLGVTIGETHRVRFVFENSGLPVTDQEFLLEYAAKGASPSCEAVSAASFAPVPPQASCSGSPICTQTSSQYADGDPTTDLLGASGKTFIAGEIIESPSNITSEIDITTDEYTEIEYAVTATNDATDDAYCLRTTDNGSDYDSYLSIAEFQLGFSPTISALSLNNGVDISLLQGATTTVYATGTVSDLNGYADLDTATTTIYRSGVGENCTLDDNNCYRTTSGGQCSFTNCSGNSCDIECSVDIWYFAEPTDAGTYAGETWRAFASVSDTGGAIGTGTAPSIDLLTTRALNVTSPIDYGLLAASSTSGSVNATTTIQNTGNEAIDIAVDGVDLTDGGSSIIPVTGQKYATTTFAYSACTICGTLATSSQNLEVDLAKQTATSTPVTDEVYWGIRIPYGVAGTAHQGTNTFYAISD